MNFSPRQLCAVASLLLVAALGSNAFTKDARATDSRPGKSPHAIRQSIGKGKKPLASRAQAKRADASAAREAGERRQALALLLETIEAARALDDLEWRMDILSLAADALWPHDERSARAVFINAWEIARRIDDDVVRDEREDDEDGDAIDVVTEARHDLLPKIAGRDPRLAERLLKDLMREEMQSRRAKEEGDARAAGGDVRADASRQTTRAGSGHWGELSREGVRRLDLVRSLMQAGDFERAALLAAPLAAEGPSVQLMTVLHDFRAESAKGADEIYARLLERALSDASADANDVLLLSSYVVSPELIVVVDAQGSVQYHVLYPRRPGVELKPQTEVPTNLRRLFYNVAATVLARPSGAGASRGEAVAPFFAIGRVLPFVEREAPQLAPALHARRAALTAEIDADRRERLAPMTELRSLTHKNPIDPLGLQLEEVRKTRGEAEGDRARFAVVHTAVALKLWARARAVTDEIGDAVMRRDALNLITAQQVLGVGDSFEGEEAADDWERAAAFVRSADVPPLIRALGLAQAAELAAHRGKRERAAELMREAVNFAEQIEAHTVQRFGALATLTTAAARFDAARAWELLPATIRAANAIEDHLDFHTTLMIPPRGVESHNTSIVIGKSPAPEDVFAAMARLDFSRALAELPTLKPEVARAYAAIAVARVRLGGGAQGVRKAGEKQ